MELTGSRDPVRGGKVVRVPFSRWEGGRAGWLVTISRCRWCGNKQVDTHPARKCWPLVCQRCGGATCVPCPLPDRRDGVVEGSSDAEA